MDFTGDESSESGEETIPPVTIRDQEPNIKTRVLNREENATRSGGFAIDLTGRK